MGRPASTKKCPACGEPELKRNGTRNGKVRWRCTNCNASATRRRQDQKELATFARFLTWISGKQTQKHFDATTTGRSLRRRISWCWNIPVPTPPVTGKIHDQIFIDGTYLAYGWCLLITRSSTGLILGWQWNQSTTRSSKSSKPTPDYPKTTSPAPSNESSTPTPKTPPPRDRSSKTGKPRVNPPQHRKRTLTQKRLGRTNPITHDT